MIKNMKNKKFAGYSNAIASGALYGLIPVVVLGATKSGNLPGTFCVMFRVLFAMLTLLPFAVVRWKKHSLDCRQILLIAVAALFNGMTTILLYEAFAYIPSSIGIALHFTYPLVTMCLCVCFFHARVNVPTVLAMLLSLCGIVVLCDNSVMPVGAGRGIVLALLSSLTFSIYFVWTERKHLAEIDSVVFTTILTAYSSVLIGIYNFATGRLDASVSAKTWILFIAAGVIACAGIVTQVQAVKSVGSVLTTILGTLEPIVCTIGSALALKEAISLRTVLGSVMVIVAVIVATLFKGNEKAAKAT